VLRFIFGDRQKKTKAIAAHAISTSKCHLTYSATGGSGADAERVMAVRYDLDGLAFTSSLAILLACVLSSVTAARKFNFFEFFQ
jgi:hypothetical protein